MGPLGDDFALGEKQLVRRGVKNRTVPLARYVRCATYGSSEDDEIARRLGERWCEITKCRGTLRAVVTREVASELLEPASQGVGVETQEGGCALRPVDHSACLSEDALFFIR